MFIWRRPLNQALMGFVEALAGARDRIPLMFEPLPPSKGASPELLEAHIDQLADALHTIPGVDAVNVPQIIGGTFETVDAGDHALAIQSRTGLEGIVNTIVALLPEADLTMHLHDTYQDGIAHTVLVGGESSKETYPGPSVRRANEISDDLDDRDLRTIGNICIPSRRRLGNDEPDRMVAKTLAGADFFTSQIVLEPVTFRRLLRDYETACAHSAVQPATVFLGLSPVTSPEDLKLLKMLGVEVPPHVERDLLWDTANIGHRSLELNLGILRNVLDTLRHENIRVPLGLNVEQVSQHNWDASCELATECCQLLEEHHWLMGIDQEPDLPGRPVPVLRAGR